MSASNKPRAFGSKAFSSPRPSGFGGFTTASSSLSYVSEPPDLAAVSDANAVVSLKNLLKKDSTTRAKALDDLILHAQAHPYEKDGGVEDPVLDAWVKLYPQISIDNSRRVRELSHTFQFELMKSARKRMEKRIPNLAGSWLAGTFDKDRVVSRSASEGLSSFITTEDKAILFWRRLQGQILDFALEAVRETLDTLSDERSTTKEDSEAKYYRVVGAALLLVLNLLQKVGTDSNHERFDQFLGTDSVWALAAADDSFVRRTVCQLAQGCLQTQPDLLKPHLPRIGRAFVSDALKIKQTGSALDLIQVLATLSTNYPEIWGSKKAPLTRLQQFVERGSQGTSSTFWQELRRLIVALAGETVRSDVASNSLKALRVGISNREEPRTHAPYAWGCYLETFLLFLDRLEPEQSRLGFIKDSFYPITAQYLHPAAERSSWTAGAPLSLLPKAWVSISSSPAEDIRQSVEQEWQRLAETFIARMSNSLPEVSKDFKASQQGVADEGDRWFSLVGAITTYASGEDTAQERGTFLNSVLEVASTKVLQGAVDLLTKRNFKPFGAASVIESGLKRYQLLFLGDNASVVPSLFPTDRPEDLESLLGSPSSSCVLSCFNMAAAVSDQPTRYESIWTSIIEVLLHSNADYVADSITILISTQNARSRAQEHRPLQEFLVSKSMEAAKGTLASWDLFEAALAYEALAEPNVKLLAANIVQLIGSPAGPIQTALKAMELILHRKPSLLSHGSDIHVQLVTKLLALAEISGETVSHQAAALRTMLDKHNDGLPPLVGIVQENLDTAGPVTLEIDTLVEQAKSLIGARGVDADQLLPNTNIWMEELLLFLQDCPDPSLSLFSSLGGAYSLVQRSPAGGRSKPRRDRRGCAIPARMALYTAKLLGSGFDLFHLPLKFQVELLYLLYLVVELAEDQLVSAGVRDDNQLWSNGSSDSFDGDVEGFLTSARNIFNVIVGTADEWKDRKIVGGSLIGDLIAIMMEQAKGVSPLALYSAKALGSLIQSLTEAHGLLKSAEKTLTELEVMKVKPHTVLITTAFLTGFGEALAPSNAVRLLCNRLVSDVAGSSPTDPSTLSAMVLLNACMSVYGPGELPVDNRRQVFAVRQITSWTEQPDQMSTELASEACRALTRLFPNIGSVYGSYWEQAIKFCIWIWTEAGKRLLPDSVPCLHASLKLTATLESMVGANDDLDDALAAQADSTSEALLHLLKARGVGRNQRSHTVDALLCRRVAKIPLQHVKDVSELYGLVASESKEVQTAAFDILHRALAEAQSKVSIDVLLEKRDAKLPDELLSLLLDAPVFDSYPDDVLASFPNPVRSYLLSWLLVYDAFRGASFKVRGDYTENLKASDCLAPLMTFMFDVLGHSAARPLNLDKAGFEPEHIRSYDIQVADGEPDERSMRWLLVHLFYLSLKYVPGLFKSWFRDCRSKQTTNAVESWMTKYFSPLVISESLDEVAEWAANQEPPEEDENELLVKVSRAAKEITAGYEVDELHASIAIRIPAQYPLEPVEVSGINRVAASESKWKSWIMITQGVINFSNGSIIDGLAAFRRNVVGALKGQTECAICYSIISTDKKMPDKRCTTCKNLFHGACLFKWFQTSHQNTCPLCRNPIDYLGSR